MAVLAFAACTQKDPLYCKGCWQDCAAGRPDICLPSGGFLDGGTADTAPDITIDMPPDIPACVQPSVDQLSGVATATGEGTTSTDPGCQRLADDLNGVGQQVSAGRVLGQPIKVVDFDATTCTATLLVLVTFPGDGASCDVSVVLTMGVQK